MQRIYRAVAVTTILFVVLLSGVSAETFHAIVGLATNRTEAAGTVINVVAPARVGFYTRVSLVKYTAGGTAHSLYVMRPLGRTSCSADAAASQAVINLAADPGPTGNLLAANDFLVILGDDAVPIVRKVSSITGLAVTVDSNFAAKVSKGAAIWNYGVVGDTDPVTGAPHLIWSSLLAASATTTFTGTTSNNGATCVASTLSVDQPLLLQSNNATAAGTFVEVHWQHAKD